MVLLTIQMMLRVHFVGRSFEIEVYEFGSGTGDYHEIHAHLETLHLVCEAADDELDEDDIDESEPGASGQAGETA